MNEDSAIERERLRLTDSKSLLQSQLTEIKHRMLGSGRLPDVEYHELSRVRASAASRLAVIDGKLAAIKRQLHQECQGQARASRMASAAAISGRDQTLLRGVLRLRDLYRAEMADRTRTEAVRFMAKTFADQLDQVLSSMREGDA